MDELSILIPELRVSPKWIILVVTVMAMLLVPLSKPTAVASYTPEPINLTLLYYALAALVWLTERRWPAFARGLTTAALVGFVVLTLSWLKTSGGLALLPLPILLSALLMGPVVALIVAGCETCFVLVILPETAGQATPVMVFLLLVAVWASVGVVFAVYQPLHQISEWLGQYYVRMQSFLEEARQHKMELNQTLENLAHANRQLALASERMAALRAIAEEAQKAKTMFLAKVSHEFRTPLNMIIGLVGLIVRRAEIGDEDVPTRLLEDLRVVYRNCEHLSNMINDVLDLSQIDAGRMTLHREYIRLDEVMESALAVVRPLAEKKGLELRSEIPADMPKVYCDRVRIRQVILNLLSNAVRFTTQGHVLLRAEIRDQKVLVQVSDTGPGIPPENAERIFEPFDQGTSQMWRDQGGSGLGLSISRQFVRLHGGRMWLESQPGAGSTFTFELPITPPSEPIARPGHWIREDWVWREQSFRTDRVTAPDQLIRPRIVVADETGELCSRLAHLTDEVEFVDGGSVEHTIEMLRHGPAHVVIVNTTSLQQLWLHIEALRHVAPQTPIIGCTVPRSIERALAQGATDYLTKPVLPTDLDRAIAALGRPISRVLIVDDDPDVLALFRGMLRLGRPMLRVDVALSAQQALQEMRRQPPDLVLLDLMMPEMDGWEFLREKEQDETIRDVPVIVISALDPSEQPLTSPLVVGALGGGLSINQLLRCVLAFPGLVSRPLPVSRAMQQPQPGPALG